MQRWRKAFSVWKFSDNLFNFGFYKLNLFLDAKFKLNVSFFAKTVVYYYSNNSDMPMTSIAGIREKLFVYRNDVFLQNLISSFMVYKYF